MNNLPQKETIRSVLSRILSACLFLLMTVSEGDSQSFVIGDSQFLLNGKPFQIISGELHYTRIPPAYWKDRLSKARAMGLNTVATYVFWNIQEPEPGVFNFAGDADIARFIRTAQEVGLYVILRPGPYVCAEWDFGGFPSWLLKDTGMRVRSADPRFLSACKRYLSRLGQELAPLQITRGGPIILVQVENEYGSFGKDTAYLCAIRDFIRSSGFEVPLFSADGPSQITNAYISGVFPGVNGATGDEILKALNPYLPHGPYLVPEFYPGWLDHWGEPHAKVDADETAKNLDWMLSHGVSVSLYMFHGGTNFGFLNGANFGGRFQPQPTSYDYDAPLDEAGRPTPKFHKLREVIKKHLQTGVVIPDVPTSPATIEIPAFLVQNMGGLFNDWLPNPVIADQPRSMEDIGQSYGYLLYRAELQRPPRGLLDIRGLCDYGIVYLNGKKIASLDRRYRQHVVQLNGNAVPATLDILVENGGRINYGKELLANRKGITDKVTLDGKEILHWKMYPFPLNSVPSFLPLSAGFTSGPTIYRGVFTIDKPGDSFLDMQSWGKGCVWVNGHNLGRYWYIGPQQTLYLPGVWLRKGENQCIVLEMEEQAPGQIRGLREPILDRLMEDRLRPSLPPRMKGQIRFSDSDLVAKGDFKSGDTPQDVAFTVKRGRYICLRSLSSLGNDHFASASELYVLDERGNPLPRGQWKIYAVDSEELLAEDGRAENCFDGDPETIWHTEWGSSQPDHPHYIVIDIGVDESLNGFRYVPREGDRPGKIKTFMLYVRETPFEVGK